MKKLALMALSLIIVMMCVSPTEVMGQSRRSANPASSTSVHQNSPASGSSRSTATKNTAAASSRTTSTSSRDTRNINSGANHNTAAATRNVNNAPRNNAGNATRNVASDAAKRNNNAVRNENAAPKVNNNNNAARNVASNSARHDNVAPKHNGNVAPKANGNVAPKANGNAPKMNNNNPPRDNDRMRNEAPRGNNNPPRDNGRMRNDPPRGNDFHRAIDPRHHEPRRPAPVPRPPRGSHYRASVIGALITIAHINALNNAIHRAERAARLAGRYAVVINRNYTPRTYASIVETVNDNIDYYYRDGVFYIIGADGDYYVIEPPIGALVEEIPADFERVVIDDEIFYKVDDTLYKVTVLDGIPYFEVVLNL